MRNVQLILIQRRLQILRLEIFFNESVKNKVCETNRSTNMAISWHLAKSFLIVLSFGPLIDCQNLTKKNQSSELTSQNRLVEGYSLPGGKLTFVQLLPQISCRKTLLSTYFLQNALLKICIIYHEILFQILLLHVA